MYVLIPPQVTHELPRIWAMLNNSGRLKPAPLEQCPVRDLSEAEVQELITEFPQAPIPEFRPARMRYVLVPLTSEDPIARKFLQSDLGSRLEGCAAIPRWVGGKQPERSIRGPFHPRPQLREVLIVPGPEKEHLVLKYFPGEGARAAA